VPLSRREFTKSAALALPLSPVWLTATPRPVAAPLPQQPEPSAEARGLGEWIRARYGDRLTANEFTDVLREIDSGLVRAAKLRTVPLSNADEPDIVFQAFRAG